jgi:ElaB/YqjD/DUF883 family membrane-anchored ribosome-binding protein
MSNDRFGNLSAKAEASQNAVASGVAEMATTAGEQLTDVAHQAKEAVGAQYDKLSDAIRAKPIQAAGIAVGVGFVLALLARR